MAAPVRSRKIHCDSVAPHCADPTATRPTSPHATRRSHRQPARRSGRYIQSIRTDTLSGSGPACFRVMRPNHCAPRATRRPGVAEARQDASRDRRPARERSASVLPTDPALGEGERTRSDRRSRHFVALTAAAQARGAIAVARGHARCIARHYSRSARRASPALAAPAAARRASPAREAAPAEWASLAPLAVDRSRAAETVDQAAGLLRRERAKRARLAPAPPMNREQRAAPARPEPALAAAFQVAAVSAAASAAASVGRRADQRAAQADSRAVGPG